MTARSEARRNLKPSGATPRGDATQRGQKEERHTLMLVGPNEGPTEMEGLSHDGETGDSQEKEEGSTKGTDEEKMRKDAKKEELQWAESR